MNIKKLAIFGASAVVLAGGLVYALGIFPPASSRDGRGAIGQRDVYRAQQASDASVNPSDAPVASTTEQNPTTSQLQNGQIQNGQVVALQSGVVYQLANGNLFLVQSGQMQPLQNGAIFKLNTGEMGTMRNGLFYQLQNGIARQQVSSNQFVHQLSNGIRFSLQQNGMIYQLQNGQMLALQQNGMNRNQMQSGNYARF